jgi:hypothetical protein
MLRAISKDDDAILQVVDLEGITFEEMQRYAKTSNYVEAKSLKNMTDKENVKGINKNKDN